MAMNGAFQRLMFLGLAVFYLGSALVACASENRSAQAQAPSGPSAPAEPALLVPFIPTPTEMDLCGEAVPLGDEEVWERFDREFTIVVYSHAQVYLWLKRAERFFPWFENELERRGLPRDLKYVAVAESDLQHTAASPMGAVGIWQFIPATGNRYGLNAKGVIDERYDFEKATGSALNYLKDLHEMFGNWALAIAAYNCGEGRVRQELAQQKVRDYYSLKLPLETERYVFRILAIKAVLSDPARYGYALPAGAGYRMPEVETVSVHFPVTVPIQAVADLAGITYREFKRLNPSFRSSEIPSGTYLLRFSKGRGDRVVEGAEALAERFKPRAVVHIVQSGDTLTGIARRYGVTTDEIKRWNGLRSNTIRIGQRLQIQR